MLIRCTTCTISRLQVLQKQHADGAVFDLQHIRKLVIGQNLEFLRTEPSKRKCWFCVPNPCIENNLCSPRTLKHIHAF